MPLTTPSLFSDFLSGPIIVPSFDYAGEENLPHQHGERRWWKLMSTCYYIRPCGLPLTFLDYETRGWRSSARSTPCLMSFLCLHYTLYFKTAFFLTLDHSYFSELFLWKRKTGRGLICGVLGYNSGMHSSKIESMTTWFELLLVFSPDTVRFSKHQWMSVLPGGGPSPASSTPFTFKHSWSKQLHPESLKAQIWSHRWFYFLTFF